MELYVILDYAETSDITPFCMGSKEAMEQKLEELRKAQSPQDDPGRYDIMSLKCYEIAFGSVND